MNRGHYVYMLCRYNIVRDSDNDSDGLDYVPSCLVGLLVADRVGRKSYLVYLPTTTPPSRALFRTSSRRCT